MTTSIHSFGVILFIAVILGVVIAGCTSPAPAASTPATTAPVATTSVSSPVMTMSMVPADTTMVATPQATATPSSSGNGQTVPITLTAENFLFDKKTITVPAGSTVVMTFTNKDAGVPHNFALYTDTSASKKIFSGEIITGVKTVTYTFTAPSTPGNYFFRCDVHPTIMFGTFVVT
jgi:plastocyanin